MLFSFQHRKIQLAISLVAIATFIIAVQVCIGWTLSIPRDHPDYPLWNNLPSILAVLSIISSAILLVFSYKSLLLHRAQHHNRLSKNVEEELKLAKKLVEKFANEADAANRAKSAFLSTMSHEIRTPLNGVIGMTSLLLESDLTPQQREYLHLIHLSGESLLAVINDILDYSKIESGKFELELNDFDLHALVEESVDMYASRAYEKGLDIGAIIDTDVPNWLNGDPTRIQQILTNLISNAVKFTSTGEIAIRVSLENMHKHDESSDVITLRCEISDTGIGISPEVKQQLFKFFYQGDSSTSRGYSGTGLGLVIAQCLVERMGGKIRVESTAGKGSKFSFTLQLHSADSIEHYTENETLPSLSGVRLLIVDDSPLNCRIAAQQASAWGMRYDVTENGIEALAKINIALSENDPYALALIDYVMPLMNGLELAKNILALPGGKKTALIMMTSFGQSIQSKELKKIGLAACLTKPVKSSKLHQCLSSSLLSTQGYLVRQDATLSTSQNLSKSTLETLNVLVAEDYAVNQQVIMAMLKSLGVRKITIANNGIEVLELIKENTFDLIFMDCQMPKMDGYITSRNIREQEKSLSHTHIPIIAMTAHAMHGDRKKCLAAGMDDYIPKPIEKNEIIRVFTQWLGIEIQTAPIIDTSPQTGMQNNLVSSETPVVLDRERLLSITGEDADVIAHFMKIFVDATGSLLQNISSTIQTQNFELGKEQCHHLKGSCGNCGAMQMYELAKSLEVSVLQKNWTTANILLQEAQKAFDRVKNFQIISPGI
jgi:signal transduction histidine kinase/DNA-binding response OmpR family regulator